MTVSMTQKAKKIIVSNKYLTLATADAQGIPWAAPLFYAYDDEYNFYFLSAKDSLHAEHIEVNHRVALAIFDSTVPLGEGDGVQIEGHAEMAGFSELPRIIHLYYKQRFVDIKERARHTHGVEDFAGLAIRRFYKVVPIRAYTLDTDATSVDRRVEIDLKRDE
jgi:uncharacterized protein YhbP (UPF0306 family)